MERPTVTAVGRLLTPKHGEPQVIDRITIKRRMVPQIVSIKHTRITAPPRP
jgi:hypothetical protein